MNLIQTTRKRYQQTARRKRLRPNKKKGALLVFDEIENKKVASSVFLGIKK